MPTRWSGTSVRRIPTGATGAGRPGCSWAYTHPRTGARTTIEELVGVTDPKGWALRLDEADVVCRACYRADGYGIPCTSGKHPTRNCRYARGSAHRPFRRRVPQRALCGLQLVLPPAHPQLFQHPP